MNREEFIGKLQMVYVGDRNAFNEIVEDNQKLKNELVYSKVEIDRLTKEYERMYNELVYSKVEIDRLDKEYERIYNENCKLREEHNITDIKLLDENNRLKNIIDELEKWLKKEHENGYEVYYLMAIQDILDKLKALKEK